MFQKEKKNKAGLIVSFHYTSCLGEAFREESRKELRSSRKQETHLLYRRHEHARGGRLRHGATSHTNPPTHGLQSLVLQTFPLFAYLALLRLTGSSLDCLHKSGF